MHKFIVLITATLLSTTASARVFIDAIDLSGIRSSIAQHGIITKDAVDSLESKALDLFDSGQCEQAIPALEDYASKANFLATLIAASFKPFYNASHEKREIFEVTIELVNLEASVNEYLKKRNIAYAMVGECYLTLGQSELAVPMIVKSLELFDIEEDVWWERSATNLLKLIGVDIDPKMPKSFEPPMTSKPEGAFEFGPSIYELRVITEAQAEDCAFIRQESCTTKRGLNVCIDWHQKFGLDAGADSILYVSQTDSSTWIVGNRASMVANYYKCEAN